MAAAIVTLVLLLLTASTILALRRGERERTGGFDKKEHHVLVGHVISLHNVTSPMDCALLCVADMRCASYNIRKKVICELSNETETSKPGSLQQDPECDYYHGLNETLAIFTTAMPTPAETTTTALTTTAPLPTTAPSTNYGSCLGLRKAGVTSNGVYKITLSGVQTNVFCDMTSEPNSAWTMVISFARKNRRMVEFCSRSFKQDFPRNPLDPTYLTDYRMSRAQMNALITQSTHWRITTDFPKVGVDYRDYVRAKFSSFDVMTFEPLLSECKEVDLINIRGHTGTNIKAQFWQLAGFRLLHVDSSFVLCDYKVPNAVFSENNFAFYCESDASMNPLFRGTTTEESTTEYWFGGYVT